MFFICTVRLGQAMNIAGQGTCLPSGVTKPYKHLQKGTCVLVDGSLSARRLRREIERSWDVLRAPYVVLHPRALVKHFCAYFRVVIAWDRARDLLCLLHNFTRGTDLRRLVVSLMTLKISCVERKTQ